MTHDQPAYGLWTMDSGRLQLGDLRHVRLQLFQAGECTGLAHFQRVFCVHRGAVCGDVWFPAHPIPSVRLAANPIPRSGHSFSQLGAFVVDRAGRKGGRPFRPAAYRQLCVLRLRLLSVVYRVERAVPRAAQARFGDCRTLCPNSTPTVRRLVVILLGFLLQWPTLLTLLMFPILILMYRRLAVTEETEMRSQFGPVFDSYAKRTPRFFPHINQASKPV